ncbi:transient receptor potential cation channel subfamily V member 3-like isoform X1 [Pelodiscus sinensis]|uniref:transient receptor potential cation channel subfamily V member 3-like isoform X1 n=1 Tax=Pelodiscus sinensis TaxID=13735 RepID=UPI003F6D1D1E
MFSQNPTTPEQSVGREEDEPLVYLRDSYETQMETFCVHRHEGDEPSEQPRMADDSSFPVQMDDFIICEPCGEPSLPSTNGHYDQVDSSIETSGWNNRDVSDFFDDVAKGDLKKIKSWLSRIQRNKWQMDELREKETGKTCLMKALLNPVNNSPETTEEIVTSLIECAKGSGCLKKLLDASFTAKAYEGQTALHIAIEKRLDRIVKLLVENGADVHIQAKGTFFQPLTWRDDCFYFGEYPLSQAACTNQPKLVEFLLDKVSNPYAQDSLGNTVLHALVMVADDSEENTAFVTEIYDQILKASEKKCIETRNESKKNLEKISNKEGLTPLQLAATYGKIKIFQHILGRSFPCEGKHSMAHLSRKFVEWAYGPVCCSLYDLSEVDTGERHSALKIVVYNTNHEKHYDMLDVEPLKELIGIKWRHFAAVMFGISTALYLLYITIFTVMAAYQPQINQQMAAPNTTVHILQQVLHEANGGNPWLLVAQIYTLIAAISFLVKSGLEIFWMWPFTFRSILQINYFYVLFFIQALLVICAHMLCFMQMEVYVIVRVSALVLGWFNILYYFRGFRITGIYTVMVQKMILVDVSRFLLVYGVFLVGFGAGLASLMNDCPQDTECSRFHSFHSAVFELFKLTLGLGDLSGHEDSKYPKVFMLLLICYVILTFVLLLNMLIALMGETVNSVSQESEKIWKLQKAMTILDLERSLPVSWRKWLQRKKIHPDMLVGYTPDGKEDQRTCLRVNDVNKTYWSNTLKNMNEDPGPLAKEKKDGSRRDAV